MRLYADILERHGMRDFVYHTPVEEHIDYRTATTVVEPVRPSVPPIAAMRECVCGAIVTDEVSGRMDWPDGTPHTHRIARDAELLTPAPPLLPERRAPVGHASHQPTPRREPAARPAAVAAVSGWRIEVPDR